MQKLKQWLLPHKTNHYHPHAIRPMALAMLVAALLLINGSYNFVQARSVRVLGYATSISSGEVIALSNQERASAGLPALATNAQLNQAAANKAAHMFANDYWAHVAPDGTSPWYFVTAAGYSYSTAGENLAKDFNTSTGVVAGWMGSAGHRANILNGSFRETGVAVMNGTLLGAETTLVVAMYAAPVSAPTPAPAPSAPAPSTPAPQPAAPAAASAPAPAPVVTKQAPTPAPAPSAQSSSSPAAEQPQPTSDPALSAPPNDNQPVDQPQQEQTSPPAVAYTDSSDGGSALLGASQSLSVREPMNWAQRSAIFLLSIILLVNVLKHTIVWRAERRGWRHIWLRSHPVAQYGLILVAIIANVVSSVGIIQ